MHKGSSVKLRHPKKKDHLHHHIPPPTHLADPSNSSSPEQPESASSLRRHVEASLMKYHQSNERTHAPQPRSPASYSSSMEVVTYNPQITPTSSLEPRRRHGESGYNLKTSTELLKVLNRIWSLEEQHTSNISLMKALKIELNHARLRIKELLQERQADRQEIDDLMKQVAEDNLVRKSKEQDRIKAAIQSVKDEVEDERKLRKRSESLHRKLARELSDVKYAFAKTLKELERERKARILLEDLCDEFAKGIREYDHEVRSMNHKFEMDHSDKDDHDRLILHISEAWLDERMQMKLAESRSNNLAEKKIIVEKLSSEIETFLQAKRSSSSNSNNSDTLHQKDLKKDVSMCHEEDSHSIELNKNEDERGRERDGHLEDNEEEPMEVHGEEMKLTKKKLSTHERNKSHIKFLNSEEQGETTNRAYANISETPRNYELTKVKPDGTQRSKSNNVSDKLIRSQSVMSNGEKFVPREEYKESSHSQSAWRLHASPVKKWMSKFSSPDIEISESSAKWPRGLKESTLKAKLFEARVEGHHSRVKSSKGPS